MCYMPAYMPNIQYANLYICYSAISQYASIYVKLLYLSFYAGCHMPRLVCQFLYVEYHVLASYCEFAYQFICLSQHQFLHAICQISYASYSILAFICRHMSA
jgi:hypothetical protein